MRQKLQTAHGKQVYLKRMYTVEPVFGDMKWNRGKLATNLRGLARVSADFLLMCLAHNIRKLVKRVHANNLNMPTQNLIEYLLQGFDFMTGQTCCQ